MKHLTLRLCSSEEIDMIKNNLEEFYLFFTHNDKTRQIKDNFQRLYTFISWMNVDQFRVLISSRMKENIFVDREWWSLSFTRASPTKLRTYSLKWVSCVMSIWPLFETKLPPFDTIASDHSGSGVKKLESKEPTYSITNFLIFVLNWPWEQRT